MTGQGNNNHVDDGSTRSNDGTAKKRIGEYRQSFLLDKAREIVEDRTKGWEITDVKAEERIPRFYRDGTFATARAERRRTNERQWSVNFSVVIYFC